MVLTIDIKDQDGNVTNHWEGPDQASADQWVSDNESSFPEGYTKVLTDVTAQREQDEADAAAIARGDAKQSVGRKAIAMLNQVHEEMGITGDALVALAGNPQLLGAVVMIMGGALKTGGDVFRAVGAGKYTDDQITRILRPIAQSGLI